MGVYILINLLPEFSNILSRIKKIFDDTDTVIAQTHRKNELKKYILIGTKIDKKPHEGVFINLGEDEKGKKIIGQINLTAHQNINVNNEIKIASTINYQFIKKDKIVRQSYETPVINKYLSLSELNKIKQAFFSSNGIRGILKGGYTKILFLIN